MRLEFHYFLHAFGFFGLVLVTLWRILPVLITYRSSDYSEFQAANELRNIIWTVVHELNIQKKLIRQEVSLLEAANKNISLPRGIYFDIPLSFQNQFLTNLGDSLRSVGNLESYPLESVNLYKLYHYQCLPLNVFLSFSNR